jgi:hypothetical protein
MLSNWTAAGAAVTANTIPACAADGAHGLTYTNGTGIVCTGITGGVASSISVGTTTISGGTTGRIEYNNAGTLGEYSITGTGNAVMSASPTLTGTVAGASSTWSGSVGIDTATMSDTLQIYGSAAAGPPTTLSISTATFTPTFNASNDFIITLVHASCPCTLANPSGTIVPGQTGVIYINQSSTGSDTIGTWGSYYESAGGTSTITLSTAASAKDAFSYKVYDATHIELAPILNLKH